MWRSLAIPGVLVALLAGCIGVSGAASPSSGPGTKLAVFRGHGIQFSYPASWKYRHGGFSTTMSDPIIDLGAQPLSNPCGLGGRDGCGFPVLKIEPGGAVMMVVSYGAFTSRPGKSIRSLPASSTSDPAVRQLHCDKALIGIWITKQPDGSVPRGIEFSACLRAPGLAANERAFRAIVRSAKTV